MKNTVYISKACLERLPKYLRVLKDNRNENVEYVSSTIIANELNFSSIQVRKDLALISKNDGKPGKGFNVGKLIEDLEDFLGIDNMTDAIIVGAGKLGQALLNYKGFANNVNIVMAFDNDKEKCDNKKIFYISKFDDLVKRMNINIGIITVPKEEAQNVCDMMIKAGIKAIWNFAPIKLNVPSNVVVKDEDLSGSLLILLKSLNKK